MAEADIRTPSSTDTLRLATSSLEGSARRGSALCPDGLQAYAKAVFAVVGVHVREDSRCAIVALGDSQINLTSFGGQISGNFWVVVNSDATNLTDAQELVIMNGTFSDRDVHREAPAPVHAPSHRGLPERPRTARARVARRAGTR